MTLAGLPDRRRRAGGTGLRWLAAGLIVTVLVLLVDASINSRSPGQVQSVAAGTWIDRVLPVVASSSAEGRLVEGIWAEGLKTPVGALAGEVRQLSSEATAIYGQVVGLRPPPELAGASGLLEACLLARREAAAKLSQVVLDDLGAAAGGSATAGASPASLVSTLSSAGSDIQVGDSAYQLYLRTFPASLGVHMPVSQWVTDPGPYQPQAAQVFLASLQSAAVTTPVHQVRIYSVTPNPSPESTTGGAAVLPDATALTVTVVLADTGNQPESNLTVTASLSPAAANGTASVRDFVNLKAGQAYTISAFGPLNPVLGQPSTLTVTVTPGSGSGAAPVSSTLAFSMPAPPPPTTTTTSTTAPPAHH